MLLGGWIALGPGKVRLLDAIENTGSISAAARSLGMSYRRAWNLVDAMNRCFRQPLVDTEIGGSAGGGARITAAGEEARQRYRDMEAKAAAALAQDWADFSPLLKDPDAPSLRG
ncbi:MAG: winged helix-turn-helix domain-containing protein [Thioalkalivibrionaceae bacterium]